MLKKASFCAVVFGFLCATAYAQLWPLPNYTTPNTTVLCAKCPAPNTNLPTPGWQDPVVRYVGRFVSSEYVGDFQLPFRTARAGGIRFTPDGSRFAVRLGNAVATYNTASFLTRLDAHEAMVSAATIPVSPHVDSSWRFNGPLELFLNFEHFFYAENSGSNWTVPTADGQDRLRDFDLDDRGLVYIAYGYFGWGIASDPNGSPLMPSWQDPASLDWKPTRSFWIKDGTDYFALLQSSGDGFTRLYKVPTYDTATATTSIALPIATLTRGAGGRSAVVSQTDASVLYVYDNHALVTGGLPSQTIRYGSNSIAYVVFDGTNFWTASYTPSLNLVLSRVAPDGTKTDFPTSNGQPFSFSCKDGYLATVTGDATGKTIHLYKAGSGTPVEIPVSSVSDFYKHAANFAQQPTHMTLISADPLVSGGKLYLIVSGDGIGDVYQIRTDDNVNVSVLDTAGPKVPNAPARATGDVFYGDTVRLNAALSSGTAGGALTWNFGALHDPVNTLPGTFGSTIPHQYTGLALADVAFPLTVSATNAANGNVGTTALTLKKGTVRVKFGSATGAKTLVTPPGTGAAIVTDDSFYDASDGDLGGHYNEWRIGADAAAIGAPTFVPQYADPTAPIPVGGCGQHTLSMTAHYGYAALNASNVDFPLTLTPVNGTSLVTYTVSAFVPGVDVTYNASTGNEEFFSTSRAAAVLAGRTFSYSWDVVNSSGNPVATIPSVSGTATSVDQIARYPVARDLFTQTGYSGRLTLSVSGDNPCSPGTGIAAQQAKSTALVPPDAQITGGCTNGICQFNVSSPSGVMQSDGWTFAWTAIGGTPSTSSTSILNNSYFTSTGDFPVSVLVTNKTGLSATPTTTAHIDKVASQCPTLTAESNLGISYKGTNTSTSCAEGHSCLPGEPIQFSVQFYQVATSCQNTLSYAWSVDGGGTQTGPVVNTSFSVAGTHTVVVTVTGGGQTVPLSKSITIASSTPPPPVCLTLGQTTVGATYAGSTAGCHDGGTCTAGENVTFTIAYFVYNPSCATHFYQWSFDGVPQAGGGTQISHAFATAGTHSYVCAISNGVQNYTVTGTVEVTGGGGNTCGTLSPNINVGLDYTGATSGCKVGTACAEGEQITLTVDFFFGYNKTCATHTYNWKVDGASIGTGTTATTTLTKGNHTLECVLSNGSQTIDLTQVVVVGQGAQPLFTFDFKGGALNAAGVPANTWVFNLTSDPSEVAGQTQWVWDFGDNAGLNTGSGVQTHTYQNGNDYTVSVHAVGQSTVVSHKLSDLLPARRRSVHH